MNVRFVCSVLCYCFLVLIAGNAPAATVYNMSDHPQILEVFENGAYTPHVIEAGSRLYRIGNVKVRFNGRDVRIEYDEEYAIWNDHEFGPQRRRTRGSGSIVR